MSTTPDGKVRVTLYMSEETKQGLKQLAEQERRSVSSMSEIILSEHLAKNQKRKLV